MKFNINDQLFLETLLMIIRGNTVKYSAIKMRKKYEEEKKLEEEINSLEEEINSDFLNTYYEKIQKLVEIKEKLVELRKEKVDGVMLRSRCRYKDLGESQDIRMCNKVILHTIYHLKNIYIKHPLLSQICSYGVFFPSDSRTSSKQPWSTSHQCSSH